MSENLDLVRSIYADWQRGDYSSAEWADPEIEFVIVDGPDPGSWTGVAGMTEGWFRFLNAWKDYRAEAQTYSEIDSERVYVQIHISGRGTASGLLMEKTTANLLTISSGKVTRLIIYWDRKCALADLGLAE
jgi:ketosteroid isomerase-like protein